MVARQPKYDGIQPDRKNANKGTERGRYMVEASLRETGAGRSILLDKDGRIIAGNKTFEAASDIGLPVRVVETDGTELVAVKRTDLDLDDDTGTARKLAYYDNRAAQVGLDWDAEQMLADLGAGLDLSAMFKQDELDELLADLQPKTTGDTPAETDRAEELRQKWGVKPGDLWSLGDHKLICGDCTDAATVARVMGGERAAAVVTDPPYNVDYGANAPPRVSVRTIVNDKMSDDDWHVFMCSWLNQAFSVSDGAFYIFMSDKELVSVTQCFKECGGHWSSYITWVKDRFVLGLKDYHSRCERALYGWREGGKHQFHGGRDKDDVWEFPRPGNSDEHPTMKPVELFARAIEMSSSSSDVVLDPFVGSGTTIIACENLARRCRACEISAAYTAVALERWSVHTGRQPVLVDI